MNIRIQCESIGDEPCATITIDRPEKANALNLAMIDEIVSTLRRCQDRTILITGCQDKFCAGVDTTELAHAIERDGTIAAPLKKLRQLFNAVEQHPRTLAFVNGSAAGGGVGMALLCKAVIAHERAHFKIPGGGLRMFTNIVHPILTYRNPHETFNVVDWEEFDVTRATASRLIDDSISDIEVKKRTVVGRLNEVLSRHVKRDSTRLGEELDREFAKAGTPEAARIFLREFRPKKY